MAEQKDDDAIELKAAVDDTGNNIPARLNFSFGYLGQGNNFQVKDMTINEAMAYSIKLGPNCIGFTCHAEPDYNKKIKIWFKDSKCSPDVHKNKEWQTYLKPTYNVDTGYLPQGYNLKVKEMTINEAKGYALLLPRCSGFTFKNQDDLDKKITIWFKQDITEIQHSQEWTSYVFKK